MNEDWERTGTLDHPCGMGGFVQVQEKDCVDRKLSEQRHHEAVSSSR